jgi:hypothetical protein
LLPRSHNGPDVEKTLIWIYKSYNSSKGSRRLYEHFAIQGGVEAAKYGMPRIAESKYLKLSFETLEENNPLETSATRT